MRNGIFLLLCLLTSISYSQERCGSVAPTTGEFENWLSSQIARQQFDANRLQATVYQIPVVVHVFHKGESIGTGVNLSDERIKAQIDSLTADFRRMNADTVNTPTEFLPVAADIEIEFVLAKQDPDGNPTDGIVRLRGSRDVYRSNSHRPLLRSESYWPPEHYLNIFVTDLQVFLGYASFPLINIPGINNNSDDFNFDGVLIDYEYFGVNPDAPAFESYGRTLTHEVGHYLGLRHIWGDGNCSVDDFVDDTPLADNDNGDYTSPCTFPNPDDTNVCIDGEPEMFQNFMDYTDDICMNLFTEGQKSRIRTVMDNAPNRTSLISSPGLVAPIQFTDDLAISHVLSPDYAECDQNIIPSVRIVNYGTNEVTNYDIELSIDGNPVEGPLNITTSIPPLGSDTITFSSQLISSLPANISFEVTNVNGNTDGDLTNNILSMELATISTADLPFFEDFESAIDILGEFGTSFPWETRTAPRIISTNKAVVFKAFNNTTTTHKNTILKTPILDLTGFDAVDLTFSYAYEEDPDAFNDGLLIRYSNDCGETFQPIPLLFEFGDDIETTTGSSASEFIPANDSEWQDISILIPKTGPNYPSEFQLSIEGLNGSGNNIYIDDVRIDVSDRNEYDAIFTNIFAPPVTCSDTSQVLVEIRNIGFATIEQIGFTYLVNGELYSANFNGLSIATDEYSSFEIEVYNTEVENDLLFEIESINAVEDQSNTNNQIEASILVDDEMDEYPLLIDFDSNNNWIIADGNSLWSDTTLSGNKLLVASGFSGLKTGIANWFVSPVLGTGNLDSAGLIFKTSYGKRDIFNDDLEVLISFNCGESYSTLLDLNSDSLSLGDTDSQWVPSPEQWKEFKADLSNSIVAKEDIRIAFVFTSGGGNDLYIDDIRIQGNEPPTYADVFRAYPNPAVSRFKVGLNLPEKEAVTFMLTDISGRTIIEQRIENAFNQILEYEVPTKEGLYFITIIGNQFKSSQKLFISR